MTTSPAPNQDDYRIGNDDALVDTHTWISAKNTATRWDRGWPQRVRIQVNQGNAANWLPAFRCHIRIGAQSSAWVSLPVTQASATTTTGSFWIAATTKEAQNAATTASACGSPPTATVWQNGSPGFSDTLNPVGAQAALNVEYTEMEWNIQCLTSTRTASTFSFRMTNNGTVFTTYTRYATVVSRATSVPWVPPVTSSAKMEPGFFTRAW